MKCKICNNEKNNQTYEVREMMFGYKDTFIYFQCSQCKCLQIANFPENIKRYYPLNYYSYQSNAYQNKIKKIIIKIRNNYALFNKGFLGKFLNDKYPDIALSSLSYLKPRKDARILDVGCGAGRLLMSMRDMGYKNLLGIDPFNAQNIEYPEGLRIEKKDIYSVKDEWDVIMFHHSFEHIEDPVNTLKNVSERLAPDGRCVIRVPICSSYAWEHYGVNWVQLDAPRHYFLHSVESMRILAAQSNLNLYNIVYDSTSFQFYGSEQYKKNIPLRDALSYSENPRNSIFTRAELSAFTKRARELNDTGQGDQAVFYFKLL
jgi:2-polyprenyl-3-methyl-5-hydroxy-6-metoxy-1,4-benzoquinol methylase